LRSKRVRTCQYDNRRRTRACRSHNCSRIVMVAPVTKKMSMAEVLGLSEHRESNAGRRYFHASGGGRVFRTHP
jgi:hypothetical protein